MSFISPARSQVLWVKASLFAVALAAAIFFMTTAARASADAARLSA